MSSEWQITSVEGIAAKRSSAMATGPFGSSISSKYFQTDGVPVIRGSNLSADIQTKLDDSGLVFVSNEKAREFDRCLVGKGDLIFTCWGTINQIGLIDADATYKNYIISNKQMKLTVDEQRADPRFVYYVFSSTEKQAEIINNGIGSSVPGFNLGQLRKHEFLLPPLHEQIAIADALDLFTSRITLLRATNANLEAIAQALFKSWFVDFDPVRAKAEGRQPEAMDADTAALFPDSFEESELGSVPKGWNTTKLGNVCDYLNRGISPKYLEAGGVLVINQKCIRDFSIDFTKARRHDPLQRKIDGRSLDVGDVLVNSTGVGTLGRVAQVLALSEPAIVDSHVTIVRAGSSLSWPFMGLWMMRQQPIIEAMGEGSTGQTELSRSKLAEQILTVPQAPILSLFDGIVKPLKERISLNENRVQVITQLRDTLLPRLISGQLRLPEADALLQTAVL